MPLLKTNKHRRNRRVIGVGSPVNPRNATVTPTVATVTVTLTYNQPMVFTGAAPLLTVATRTIVTTVVTSSTVLTLTLSGSGAGLAWTYGQNDPAARTMSGGYVAANAGTFP